MLKKHSKKIIVLVVMAVLVASFFAFGLHHVFTLDYIKSKELAFREFYAAHPLQTLLSYMGIYIVATALSFPGASVITLIGGALFGVLSGTVVVSIASTIGATLAFTVSRFLLRDYVQTHFADRVEKINEGVRKDGGFYLFTLRLVPIFPFFLINLAMGLTAIKTWRYYWVSQIGMLPGTIVYVNAGTQLGQLESLKGILSPAVLMSFVLLGVFPLIAKKMVDALRRQHVLRKFRRPVRYDYNVIVIGGGSAGLVSSYIAAAVKAKVALVEKHRMGGDCLNTGCVPSKALIRSAKMLSYAQRAPEFGFKSVKVDFSFSDVMERVQRVITQVAPHDSVERYSQLGVDCFQTSARVLSPFEVQVGDKTFTTRNIIVATGGRPKVPAIPGIELVRYVTSDNIWELRELPQRMLVLGGGPIGCELAQCFQRFGAQVTIVQRGAQLLPAEDSDVAALVMQRFVAEGIQILTGVTAKSFRVDGAQQQLLCENADGSGQVVEFDVVLLALGRQANVTGFGLEELGVRLAKNGNVEADEFMRTNYPNIFVCGDVAGPYQFTHVAAHQAWYAAVNALFSPLKTFKVDYRVIPKATFTDPEVASVGLNETQARAKKIPYEVTTYNIDDLDRAIADSEAHGMVKVLTVPGSDKILGATIVGSHAGDIIAEYVTAMKYKLGMNKILGTIHIYPTLAEANKYAAGVWKKAHAPQRVLRWLERMHAWRRGC